MSTIVGANLVESNMQLQKIIVETIRSMLSTQLTMKTNVPLRQEPILPKPFSISLHSTPQSPLPFMVNSEMKQFPNLSFSKPYAQAQEHSNVAATGEDEEKYKKGEINEAEKEKCMKKMMKRNTKREKLLKKKMKRKTRGAEPTKLQALAGRLDEERLIKDTLIQCRQARLVFMNRADGQAAEEERQGVDVSEYELKIGWDKSITVISQAPGEQSLLRRQEKCQEPA